MAVTFDSVTRTFDETCWTWDSLDLCGSGPSTPPVGGGEGGSSGDSSGDSHEGGSNYDFLNPRRRVDQHKRRHKTHLAEKRALQSRNKPWLN